MKGAGLHSTRLATGDRSRSRYGLGRGGWIKRLRTPVGYVLTGSRGQQPASLLQAVLAEAEATTGVSLHRRSTTVFESGKVVMELRGDDDREYFMRLAAGPALGPLHAAIVAVHAVAARQPRPGRARPGGGAPRPRQGGPAPLLARAERHRDPPVAHDERSLGPEPRLPGGALPARPQRLRGSRGTELRRAGRPHARATSTAGSAPPWSRWWATWSGAWPACRGARATATSGARTCSWSGAGWPPCSIGSGPRATRFP